MNVVIVDYGVGNLRSLQRGIERAGATASISADRDAIRDAPALVLPGVGAFGECMRNSAPFHDLLVEKAADTPILGVCVGLQILYDESTEGLDTGQEQPHDPVDGLGLIPGRVERLSGNPDGDHADSDDLDDERDPNGDGGDVKVPHMGWNTLRVERAHPVVEGIDGAYAYFVHSYCAGVTERTLASCDYGSESGTDSEVDRNAERSGRGGPFAAVAANDRGNVVGTQFHPEKSGATGLRLLENFVAFAREYEPGPSTADAQAGTR